ncbi:MAG: putative secreted protein [Anaerocolumna sp.]|nr:putative secreted protein [Anaerocolumna sp.]
MLLTVVLTASLAGCKSKSSEDTLIVGTEPGFAPYEYMDGNEIVGIDMDIVQAIADAMGKKLEVKSMDFEGALLAVQQGKVDLVAAGVSIDEERQKVMDFSNEYVNSTEVVVVNGDSPTVSSVEDLNDKIIGVQQGNIADFYVSNVDNVTAKEIKRYTKFNQAAEDLKNGKIDCIVMDQYPAEELVAANASLKILDGTLFEDKYAIAVKKGNKELLDEINKVIDQLKADGKIEEFTAKHTEAK